MTRRLALFTLVSILGAACASTSAEDDIFGSSDKDSAHWMPLEHSTVDFANIGWHNASAPFKRLLLIKDGQFLCGVRFVNHRRGRDKSQGSIWSSGDETLTSAYEWYVLEESNGGARAKDSGRATVKFSALRGFGHFVIAGGYENVRCGNRQFGWHYPSGIVFSQAPNSEMQLAPTRWESVQDIRLDDARLVWYSFDQKRQEMRIPIKNL